MTLEAVVVPVADVDRARQFYKALGWRLDADFVADAQFRVVQLTPPGSPCSIIFDTGITSATPGSAQGLHLIVTDIEAARAELVGHGAEVGEVFHDTEGSSITRARTSECRSRTRTRTAAATRRSRRSATRAATAAPGDHDAPAGPVKLGTDG